MGKVEELAKSANNLVNAVSPAVEIISKYEWTDQKFLPLIHRAVIRRQFDSLSATIALTKSNLGFAAACLVRPSCEEFIWLNYLNTLEESKAENLIQLLGSHEICGHVKAQENYAGASVMSDLGFTREFVRARQVGHSTVKSELRRLGKELGWPARELIPSVSFLAKATSNTDMYDFIYHATSRFVHFSVSELLRRAWVAPNENTVDIKSTNFSGYWTSFSLYWNVLIFLETFGSAQVFEGAELGIDNDAVMEAARAIGDFGMVPIVTAEELNLL